MYEKYLPSHERFMLDESTDSGRILNETKRKGEKEYLHNIAADWKKYLPLHTGR